MLIYYTCICMHINAVVSKAADVEAGNRLTKDEDEFLEVFIMTT